MVNNGNEMLWRKNTVYQNLFILEKYDLYLQLQKKTSSVNAISTVWILLGSISSRPVIAFTLDILRISHHQTVKILYFVLQ